MKSYRITIILLILACSMMFISPVENTLAETDQISRWQIVEWNNDFIGWWNWPDVTFKASNGSYLNYTTTHYEPANFTHPSNGTIEFGNLTIQATNNKTAEVLVLSIWPWLPGLITSTDWDMQEEVGREAANGLFTKGSFSRVDTAYNTLGLSRQAVNFTYGQDLSIGNQNTTLIYDRNSGVLLEGYTEFVFEIPYILHLKLVNSDLIETNNLTPALAVPTFAALLVMGTMGRKLKKRRENSIRSK
ncbi:MAG: hypothetical protein ACFFE8_13865 [Candidatus Heimdallarchaeota archaeon]